MERARRRHVPAFGEWNYYYSSTSSPDAAGAAATTAESWWYAPEDEACSDVWFRYSPPPRPRPETEGGRTVVVAVAAEHKRAVVLAPAKGARRVVVRPVDEDLYRVPPPDDHTTVSHLPRRRTKNFLAFFDLQKKRTARRSLWMGCLGLNCVASS